MPLQRILPRLPRTTLPLTRPTTKTLTLNRRPFSSNPLLRIKEDKPQSPEELEQKKQQQLEEQKQGKGRWHEELASAGEASIAADKHDVKGGDHEEHMEELQKETAVQSEKEHPHGKKD